MAKSEKMTSVSPFRLKYAREYYGLSHSDVIQKIKSINIDDLEKYEQGLDYPSYAKLEALSELYNRPLLFFFFKTPPHEEKLAVAFRSIEEQSGEKMKMQIRTMMEKADLYRLNLSELMGAKPPVQFSALLEQNNIKSTQDLIPWLRSCLDLPLTVQKQNFQKADALLDYLIDKLFDIGIYVFKDSFKADNVSGLCLYDDAFPIILLNNKTSFTRQIFTVFHEIYHLFCRETDVYYPDSSEEKSCDRFASEFLIPPDDFAKHLSDRDSFEDLSYIQELAKEYTVSPAAIAYRLLSQNKISSGFYASVQKDGIRKMNSATSGGNFYFTRISYLGRPYLKRVFADYYSGKISISTVGEYTGLKASHISRLSSNMFGGVL